MQQFALSKKQDGRPHRIGTVRGTAADRLFAATLEDHGPGRRASIASLAAHAAVVLAIVSLPFGSAPLRHRIPKGVALQETKLIDPIRLSTSRLHSFGGAHEHGPGAGGITPPAAAVRAPVSPLRIPAAAARLKVSPSLPAVEPPQIVPSFQYGDPNQQVQFLSAGWGAGGYGASADARNSAGNHADIAPALLGGQDFVYSMNDVSVVPALIYKVDPDYTEQARRSNYQGTVVLHLVIDPEGHPQQVRVARSLGLGLDEKAVEAVERWRFRPGIKDGKAVAVAANVELNFQLF